MGRKVWVGIAAIVAIAAVIVAVVLLRQEEGAVKIGAILVLTGPDAKAGQSARQGIEMAADEVNDAGGVRGKSIMVIYEDDQGLPKHAVAAANKLIDVNKVSAIVGPMWSSPTLAVAPIAEKSGTVLMSPTASSPKITEAGDYVFRTTYSDAFEGTKTAEYAYRKLGYRETSVLYINNDFGVGLKDVFSKRFRELGGEVASAEGYDPEARDFRSQLQKIKGSDADATYVVGYSEVGQVLKQARELGLRSSFISSIMFEILDVIRIAGEAAEGVVYAYVSYDPEMGDRIAKRFARSFEQRFGNRPDPEAAFSYDTVKILCSVMANVGFNPVDIRDGLYEVKGYQGVTGTTTFDENGDVVKPIGFKRVQGGSYVWETFQF